MRLGLAVVFVGIGIWEIVQPSYWASYVPPFFSAFIAINTFVMIHGVVLVIVGIAVLLGLYLRAMAVIASLIMLSIVVSVTYYFGFNDIVIRDLAILLLAMALAFDDTDYLRIRK